MEIRDPVHGPIKVHPTVMHVIDNLVLQRLRKIKQLGFADLSFPGATHTRFLHSIGVMDVARRAFDTVSQYLDLPDDVKKHFSLVVQMAGLFHDLGHPPLSHTAESALPLLKDLNLPQEFNHEKPQATHEDMTVKLLLDSDLTTDIVKTGVQPMEIAAVIMGIKPPDVNFTYNKIDYLPLLHQLISSEVDADRMDYLLRDSYFTGVSYGRIDIDWLISNLRPIISNNKAFLALHSKAIFTFEDFLLSRYHMFLMVYFHHKSVSMHRMLARFLENHPITLPYESSEYVKWDDRRLLDVIAISDDVWAKRITNNRPLKVAYEFRGPIPDIDLDKFKEKWQQKGTLIEIVDSRVELSKYYSNHSNNEPPLYVIEGSRNIPVESYTDLFKRYSRERHVIRIYCNEEDRYDVAQDLQREIEQ